MTTEEIETRFRELEEHLLALGKTVGILQDHALAVGKATIGSNDRVIVGLRGSFERHEKLAAQIREAVSRVVHSLEIGPDGEDLAATWRLVVPCVSRRESLEMENKLIDDLVFAVGQVLTREVE